MLFPDHIETERLQMRRLGAASVDPFEYHDLVSTDAQAIDEVTRYLPWDPHETVKQTADYLDDLDSEWEAGTRAEYLLETKTSEPDGGEIVGAGGLIVDWETETGLPAIWLRKRFWGRGYSGERAAAVVTLAFDRLDLSLVAIPVQDGNERSRRAVERYVDRFGGEYDGIVRNATRRPDGSIVDRHRYTITRAAYESATEED